MKLLEAKLRGIFAKFSEALPPSLPTPPKQSLRLRRPGAEATEGSPRLILAASCEVFGAGE